MKNLVKVTLVFALMLTGAMANGQSTKIGHINLQALYKAMPEIDTLNAKMQQYQNTLANRYEEMTVEYNKLLNDYQSNLDSLLDIERQDKEAELRSMQERIGNFQNTMQQSLVQRQQELLQPINEKVVAAINAVSAEKGYDYILDSSLEVGVVLKTPPEGAYDILPFVKEKLGLKK